jgi:hypothetical protein
VITVYPIGTTIYNPDKCYNGYTLFCYSFGREPEVRLIDMNGDSVNKWNVEAARAKLLTNGNLIVVEKRKKIGDMIGEYSWDGDLVWEYKPLVPAHHDVERLDNGNTLLLCRESLPKEYREMIKDPVRRSARPIQEDLVLEVTPDKKSIWEWHMHNYLDVNLYCEICNPGDWTHTNTVQSLPENKWYDAGDERFRPGNILLSPRNLGFIFIVDKHTKEIVWEYSGNYAGGLAGQHESHMIEKGLPGEGNIIVFDNGAPPMRNIAHVGKSFVLEIDPVGKRLVWKYESEEKFYSAFMSNVQRLPNGNTLICESEGPRIFEVTHEREIVWEYAIEWNRVFGRAYRYPYDYCSQLRALNKPEMRRVVPPPHVRTIALSNKYNVVEYGLREKRVFSG